jgi:two-component system LytT family sensor kinase
VLLIDQSKYQWIFKYKLHHLPFWLAYHFMWWTLRIGSPAKVLINLLSPYGAVKFLFYVTFQMVAVYFNLYFLMPRLLEKGRYVAYVTAVMITIFISACLVTSGYYVSGMVAKKTFEEIYGNTTFFSLFEGGALPSTAAAMTLAMSIRLARNWMRSRRRQLELEREKLDTELKFLKSQMNPHFLFNTINSIFVLIHKNPKMASESLAKFSDLLRYQLYECNEHQILLSQELSYVRNFIELQKLRQDQDCVEVTINMEECVRGDLTIAPFVLIPFIENAFKHVSSRNDRSNWITMDIYFKEKQLFFAMANSVSATHCASTEVVKHSGIGLKNVRRRLDLVYTDTHQLIIEQDADHYEVKLQLTLMESKNISEQLVSA